MRIHLHIHDNEPQFPDVCFAQHKYQLRWGDQRWGTVSHARNTARYVADLMDIVY